MSDIPKATLYACTMVGTPGEYEIELRLRRKHQSGESDSHFAVVQSSRMPEALARQADHVVKCVNNHEALTDKLNSALRYIEVCEAYKGAMTADEVEHAILESKVATVSIGANSCNTLASFDIAETRKLLNSLK